MPIATKTMLLAEAKRDEHSCSWPSVVPTTEYYCYYLLVKVEGWYCTVTLGQGGILRIGDM